jgi:hypothetical protein
MSDVERGTSKDKYLTGNSKRTFVDQKADFHLYVLLLHRSDYLL